MTAFTIFGRPGCGYCVRAQQVLQMKGLSYRYVDMVKEAISPEDLAVTVGRPVRSVPQIFHGKEYVGGFVELNRYLQDMRLA